MRPDSPHTRFMPALALLLGLALAGLALAGCAGANAEFAGPDARASAASAAPHAAAGNKEWWQDGPITREKVSAMCWMKYEKGRADIAIDRRADLVQACIANTRKQYAVR